MHSINLFVLFFLLQPQNLVMMGTFPECDVKLCDFEISRVILEGADVREILGTPDYVGKVDEPFDEMYKNFCRSVKERALNNSLLIVRVFMGRCTTFWE